MPSVRVREIVSNDENSSDEVQAAEQPPVSPVDEAPTEAAQNVAQLEEPSSHNQHPKHSSSRRKLVVAALAVAVIIVVGIVIMLINDRKELKQEVNRLSNPQAQSQDDAEQLKKEIGQYLQLPEDELPTVATVVDASKVKGQSFFVNAQNGDKVLLFAKSGKAILYRPSTKKIIEVAPINLNQNETTTTVPTAQPTTPAKTTR